MATDRRRRRWIPLSVDYPNDKTGTRLLAEFGPAGLALWVAYLTACKRNHIEGRITYSTEADGWARLGFDDPAMFTFDLDTFWTVTGRIKKTRKRRRGQLTDVICTTWEDWSHTKKRPQGQSETPTSEGRNTDTIRKKAATMQKNVDTMYPLDSDSDIDSDSKRGDKSPRTELKDAIANWWIGELVEGTYPKTLTPSEWGRVERAAKELDEIGATPADVKDRGSRWWKEMTKSPQGLVQNWSQLARPTYRPPTHGPWAKEEPA